MASAALVVISAATNVYAGDYLQFTCLKESGDFTIQTICIDDEIQFEKSPNDWGKRLLVEARKHSILPVQNGTEYSCSWGSTDANNDYKFKIMDGRVQIQHGSKLVLDFDKDGGFTTGMECMPQSSRVTVSRINFARRFTGQYSLLLQSKDGRVINKNIEPTDKPIKTDDIISMTKEDVQ